MKNSRSLLSRHAAMVLDPMRTKPLAAAIRKKVKRGDIVVDVGTGVGLLALIAAQSGAKHVYAIDVDAEGLEFGAEMAEHLGLAEKITFIHGLSFHLDLDVKADVTICETIGSLAFDENILATLADAKQRFLKRGGRIIPQGVELWGVPVCGAQKVRYAGKWLQTIRERDFLTAPQKLVAVDFARSFKPSLHLKKKFRFLHSGKLSGMGLWPLVRWTKGLVTDCAPWKPLTHWGQALLEVSSRRVKKGEERMFELIIEPHPDDPFRSTEILWKTK